MKQTKGKKARVEEHPEFARFVSSAARYHNTNRVDFTKSLAEKLKDGGSISIESLFGNVKRVKKKNEKYKIF